MKSVRNALRVFEEVAFRQPVGVSELARLLELPKPSVQRALLTLRDAGWIRQPPAEDGRWVVAARFALLADATPELAAVRQVAGPRLVELRDATRESVGLFALDGDRIVLVDSLQSPQVVRAVEGEPGPLPLHLTAAGRAILAAMPEPERSLLFDGARGDGRGTPTLPENLDEVAARGYAVSAREYHPELAGVASAIRGADGRPVAAVTVFGPAHRFDDPAVLAGVGDVLVTTCSAISQELRSAVRPAAVAG